MEWLDAKDLMFVNEEENEQKEKKQKKMKRRNIGMHGHTTFFVSFLLSQRRGFSLSQREIEDFISCERAATALRDYER